MIKKIIISGFLSGIILFSGCSIKNKEELTEATPPLKEVSIFTIGQNQEIGFSKTGEVKSSIQAVLMPETSAKTIKISKKVGDKIKKGETLIVLGESLSSDAIELNYKASLESINKINDSLVKMDQNAKASIRSALLNYYTAKEAFETAVKAHDKSGELYDIQKKFLENNIEDLRDKLDEFEEMPNYETIPAYQELLSNYKQLKNQKKQSEISYEIQNTDLNVNTARRQLELAVLAVENIQNQFSLQFIQTESGLLQAETGAELIKLQKDALNIKSPINGTITAIETSLNNLVAPGQIVAIVQDLDSIELTTSINESEVELIAKNDKVLIFTDEISTYGIITEISPILSPYNKKITVKIKIPQKTSLMIGQFATIDFSQKKDEIFIPLKSVSIEDDKYFVKVIKEDKTIEKRQIKKGKIIGTFIEVKEGLSKNEIIVNSASSLIKDGDKVVYKVPRV